MKKYVIAGLVLAGFSSPAFAASYWVAQGANHHCEITTTQPGGSMKALGSAYSSRADAKKAMKSATECKA
ncbi:hypothetical protein A7A08_02773 [Methyloligella halotolerans]|uniref:SPOR domain-containing protein n=1 Tax=Methyloligella halotolerans TaxID=1177755 RepID=A0A1E2RW78_9HYPH|nr:hypothetical protein [Methyloligella halotolerans]ODA66375.1 hypothetical protein A7A08_02773 [Methyloligella halotolerans]